MNELYQITCNQILKWRKTESYFFYTVSFNFFSFLYNTEINRLDCKSFWLYFMSVLLQHAVKSTWLQPIFDSCQLNRRIRPMESCKDCRDIWFPGNDHNCWIMAPLRGSIGTMRHSRRSCYSMSGGKRLCIWVFANMCWELHPTMR